MASRSLIFAICVLSFFAAALSQVEFEDDEILADEEPVFPKMRDMAVEAYSTEVQVTETLKQDSAYAIEFYDNTTDSGSLHVIAEEEYRGVYYNNDTYEILEVNSTFCTTWDADDSIYSIQAVFYGWFNENPLIIGPTAPLWFAQDRKVKYEGIEEVRDIPCDKFSLDVLNNRENITYYYYFAPKGWTTPYEMNDMRVPVRIRVTGISSKNAAKANMWGAVDVITDFGYFKPTVDNLNVFQPPLGIGCPVRKTVEFIPKIPKTFRYAAEVIDFIDAEEHSFTSIGLHRLWVDEKRKIIRFDNYDKRSFAQRLFDFNTGTMYTIQQRYRCLIEPIRNSIFEVYDEGFSGRMKTAAEVLNLNGKFYEMGKRKIRGITCDTYESVKKDIMLYGKIRLHRYVVTAYFAEDFMTIGVDGNMESQIPVAIIVTGWSSPTQISIKTQFNIFGFDSDIWKEMYAGFQLEKCFPSEGSKAYFVLTIKANAHDAAIMQNQNDLIVSELRGQVSYYAQVHDMRIPFLKVDYKPNGIYATGMMLERPPALLQFFMEDFQEEVITHDDKIKMVDAETLEDCSYSCIDEEDFTCLGFYFCGEACILKSRDIFEPSNTTRTNLGVCDTYLRLDRESSNSMNIRLKDALNKLEKAVLNQSIPIIFKIPGGQGVLRISDVVIGDGPYQGVDAGHKPYSVNVPFRKLNPKLTTTKAVPRIDMLHDCYTKCKLAGSDCATFSFCGRSKLADKECILSSDLVVRGKTDDTSLIASVDCDIYDLSFSEYFTKYPEHVSLLAGYRVIDPSDTMEHCAKECRLENFPKGKCRGFVYCKKDKICTLHEKHILDLQPDEKGTVSGKNPCIHYAAKFIADYQDLGKTLLGDESNVRTAVTLEQCAKICSVNLGDACESFNFCFTGGELTGTGTCSLSAKVLADQGITTTETDGCKHYEKKSVAHDWAKKQIEPDEANGYTSKGFTGLVIGMLALGLILGALAFVGYSYFRSRQYGEGMTVRFMKQDT